jgi:hypothetical protein
MAGCSGAICVETTPMAPRWRTACCQSRPSGASPSTTAPLIGLPAKSASEAPAPTSTSGARRPPSGVENELMASETRSRSRDSSGSAWPTMLSVPRW